METSAETSAQIAARPFDTLGLDYERAYGHLPAQHAALDWLIERLPRGRRVLDIGSGTGRPTAARLAAAGLAVTGIDVSATMVELARTQVPGAQFELADVRELPAADGCWDAVCAFFPLLQMNRADLDATLARIARWLVPGGYLAFATVPFDVEEEEIEWMGQRVRATSYPTEAYLRRLQAAGLQVVHHEVTTFHPDYPGMGAEEHLFIYARRPPGTSPGRANPAATWAAAHPLTGPFPHPASYRGPHALSQQGWLGIEARFERQDTTAALGALAGNTRVLDVGGGTGEVVQAIAARLGSCLTVEPDPARAQSMQRLADHGVTVLPGRAEALPVDKASVDAVVATWILHYTSDPDAAVAEMARAVDRRHPQARVVLVQGAPDNELICLWNQVCAPLLGEDPDHQGYLLARAAAILASCGLNDISVQRVPVSVVFSEDGVDGKAEAAADVLAGFWQAGHSRLPQLREALLPALREHFATGTDRISDAGVMLIAQPATLEKTP